MINDGTSWDGTLPLLKALKTRAELSGGYRDASLEEKRLEALAWLRMNGLWLCDKVVRRKA